MEDQEILENLIVRTSGCFEAINFDGINKSWVEEAWINCFGDSEDYVDSTELIFEDNAVKVVNEICHVCEQWLQITPVNCLNGTHVANEIVRAESDKNETATDLWSILIRQEIEIRYLVGLIFLFCSKGAKHCSNRYDRDIGTRFANLYFIILCIPGNAAFSIFQPNLFQVAVDCLRLPKKKEHNLKRKGIPPKNDSVNSKRSVRKCSYDSEAPCESDRMSDIGEITEAENPEPEFDTSDYNRILFVIGHALKALIRLLQKVPLKDDIDVLEHTIRRMTECSSCEIDLTGFDFSLCENDIFKLKKNGISYVVSLLAFKAILALCEPLHGEATDNYLKVLKNLSEYILCLDAKRSHLVRRNLVNSENSVAFVIYNLSNNPERYVTCTRILVQQLCVRVIDKSDFRKKVAQSIVTILKHFPEDPGIKMMLWFIKLTKSCRTQHRIFVLDVFSQILDESATVETSSKVFCFLIEMVNSIFIMCNDKALNVRSKALTVLSQHIKVIFCVFNSASNNINCCHSATSNEKSGTEDSNDYSKKISVIINILHRRSKDIGVYTRRAALLALTNIISLDDFHLCQNNLKILQDSIKDTSVIVRKQGIQSLTTLLLCYDENQLMQQIWVESVLPLILDPESSVQEKCMEALETILLQSINSCTEDEKIAWNILGNIASGKYQHFQRYLDRAIFRWKSDSKISEEFVKVLWKNIGSVRDPAVWLLLSHIAPFVEMPDSCFVVNYWKENRRTLPMLTVQKILQVIGYVIRSIEDCEVKSVQGILESELNHFSCATELIAVYLETLRKIYKRLQDVEVDAFRRFSTNLIKDIETFLNNVACDKRFLNDISEEPIVNHLSTLGELGQFVPSDLRRIFLIIQRLLAVHSFDDSISVSSRGTDWPSSQLTSVITPKVRAHAFITLGKLCLQNVEFTKESLPVMVKELLESEHTETRNNVVIVMIDLCRCHATILDPYINIITSCLKDTSVLVRRQTLILLTQLLQQEYIKWNGLLLFRMLSTLVDDDDDIRRFAEFSLGYLLVRRQPGVFFHYFIECLFVFNSHESQGAYNTFLQNERETKLFSLKGSINTEKRVKLYKFMLLHVTDEQRLELYQRLCHEILGAVADGIIPLVESTSFLIQDCLTVLSCEEIKQSSLHTNVQDEMENNPTVIIKHCRNFVQCAHAKKKAVEEIIPIIISLKQMLEKVKSPLLTDLRIFLRELFRDFKTEVRDMISADKQLAKEIEYDLGHFGKHQNREQSSSSGTQNLSKTIPIHSQEYPSTIINGGQHSSFENAIVINSELQPVVVLERLQSIWEN